MHVNVHVFLQLVLNASLLVGSCLQDDDGHLQEGGRSLPPRSLATSFWLQGSQRPAQNAPRVDLSRDTAALSSLSQSQSSQSSLSRLGRSQSSQPQRRSQMGF